MQIVIFNIPVEVIRKNIKNLHLSVLPPDGRVRVSAPSRVKASGSMCPGKHYMFGVSSTFFKWNTATKAMLSHFRVTRLF